jgi:capsular polysaccharide biosynthesis protein
MSAYRWFCLVTGSDNYGLVREALNMAWTANAPEQIAELDSMRKKLIGAAPHAEDSRMFPGAAVAQNSVAGVCYAMEVRLIGDVQAAVWAARQLYEAADAVVQQGAAAQTYVVDIDREQPVRMMLEGIAAALSGASSPDAADLRINAGEDGEKFFAILTGRI